MVNSTSAFLDGVATNVLVPFDLASLPARAAALASCVRGSILTRQEGEQYQNDNDGEETKDAYPPES